MTVTPGCPPGCVAAAWPLVCAWQAVHGWAGLTALGAPGSGSAQSRLWKQQLTLVPEVPTLNPQVPIGLCGPSWGSRILMWEQGVSGTEASAIALEGSRIAGAIEPAVP